MIDTKKEITSRGIRYFSRLKEVCNRCGKDLAFDFDWNICIECGEHICLDCAERFDSFGRCQSCVEKEDKFLEIVGQVIKENFHEDRLPSCLCVSFAKTLNRLFHDMGFFCSVSYGYAYDDEKSIHHLSEGTFLTAIVTVSGKSTFDSEGINAKERWEHKFADKQVVWERAAHPANPSRKEYPTRLDPILRKELTMAILGPEGIKGYKKIRQEWLKERLHYI